MKYFLIISLVFSSLVSSADTKSKQKSSPAVCLQAVQQVKVLSIKMGKYQQLSESIDVSVDDGVLTDRSLAQQEKNIDFLISEIANKCL